MNDDHATEVPRLYGDLARLWPVISPPGDYLPEASLIAQILDEFLPESLADTEVESNPSIVEFGAGGGHTLHHLRAAFDGTAVDLSDAMLANCRRLNPDMPAIAGDMRTLDLGHTFNAALIHDAVDYMQTESDARAAIQNAARHLVPGGVLILAPTYVTETFTNGESAEDHIQMNVDAKGTTPNEPPQPALEVRYTSTVHRTSDTTFELHMDLSISENGESSRLLDRHCCGLFPRATWEMWLREAGLSVTVREPEDGPATVLIGVKP